MKRLYELYRERAELADLESEAADAKKYMRVGGVFWRVFSWFEREFRDERLGVQAEIDAVQSQPTACDWCGYQIKNPCRTALHRKNCDNA